MTVGIAVLTTVASSAPRLMPEEQAAGDGSSSRKADGRVPWGSDISPQGTTPPPDALVPRYCRVSATFRVVVRPSRTVMSERYER